MKKLSFFTIIFILITAFTYAIPPSPPGSASSSGVNTTYDANSDGIIDANKMVADNITTTDRDATVSTSYTLYCRTGATYGLCTISTIFGLDTVLTPLRTLGAANTLVGVDSGGTALEFKGTINVQLKDDAAQFADSTDSTKTMQIELGSITTGTKRTLTVQDASGIIAYTTGTVERIGATFDGGGAAIAVNKIAYVHIPYAITTINQWTVTCDVDSGATGIIITPYMDAYAADTLPTTTMCTTGTAPHTTDGAGAGGLVHQAAWDCNITAIPADRIIGFKVTTAPTSATWCSVSLKVTR